MTVELAPIDAPAAYPGTPLAASCVLTSAETWPLTLDRLDETAEPTWPDRSRWQAGGGRDVDDFLAGLDAAPMADRVPVLAVGSNASAAQLRRKFARLASWAVPVTLADVTGLAVAYSAHVSRPGYVPWAPWATGESRAALYRITWLTADEVAVMDATEPNYRPTVLDAAAHSVWLESGQDVTGVIVYAGRWGVVADAGGRILPADGQREALRVLADCLGETVDHADLAADGQVRERASRALRGRAVGDRITTETKP